MTWIVECERVEIGGIRGKALTSNISRVYEEFKVGDVMKRVLIISTLKDLYGVFSIRTYDSLDPMDRGFLKDYERFNTKVFSLDRCRG